MYPEEVYLNGEDSIAQCALIISFIILHLEKQYCYGHFCTYTFSLHVRFYTAVLKKFAAKLQIVERVGFSKRQINLYQTTRFYIPETWNHHTHCHVNTIIINSYFENVTYFQYFYWGRLILCKVY
jgi:hypothetical protein